MVDSSKLVLKFISWLGFGDVFWFGICNELGVWRVIIFEVMFSSNFICKSKECDIYTRGDVFVYSRRKAELGAFWQKLDFLCVDWVSGISDQIFLLYMFVGLRVGGCGLWVGVVVVSIFKMAKNPFESFPLQITGGVACQISVMFNNFGGCGKKHGRNILIETRCF